ncbi:MAG: 50S ribosomal protein L13 [Parcubacteria group bacterium]|nr:50S ribosomal protein L13 [Parcubacteria group bacterium]MBI3075112.1 50S ribosomal protein L13 [Parcubacteria group bacterium]
MTHASETKKEKTHDASGNTREVLIDARGKKLGRLASEAAYFLMGKHQPSYRRHIESGIKVIIDAAARIDVSAAKRLTKTYTRYSGYPGGLYTSRLADVIAKKGYGEAIRKAIYGMLPANKLRKIRMKNLVIKE